MDNKTKSKVEMLVSDYTQTYTNTAIVVYHHMVHIIFNENDKAIRQLITITSNLRPRDFAGENISRYAHNILAALHYLQSHSAIPRDAAVFILEALQTCKHALLITSPFTFALLFESPIVTLFFSSNRPLPSWTP
jgi:hypothetical protein